MSPIESINGKTVENVKRIQNDEGVYLLEFTFTDSSVLKIDILQGVNHYLNWTIENKG